jgi:hypothetical protein
MVDDVPGVHRGIKAESAAAKSLCRTLSQQAADQPVTPMEQIGNRAIGSKQTG